MAESGYKKLLTLAALKAAAITMNGAARIESPVQLDWLISNHHI